MQLERAAIVVRTYDREAQLYDSDGFRPDQPRSAFLNLEANV